MQFNASLIEKFEQHAQDVVRFNMTEEAIKFVETIWPEIIKDNAFRQDHPDFLVRLEKIYYINSILLMIRLPENKIYNLFENGIQFYFTDMISAYDLWELLRGKLVTMYDIVERNGFKQNIAKFLLRNQALITADLIERDKKTFEPSIKEWLIDYTASIGVKQVDALTINQYFTDSKNYQKLSESDKTVVRTLIIFYERLKRSSAEPAGLEERVTIKEGDEIKIFREGAFEDVDPRIMKLLKDAESESQAGNKKIDITEQGQPSQPAQFESLVLDAYRGDLDQQRAINVEMGQLTKKVGANAKKLRDEFYRSIQQKNVNRTIAALRLMAQNDDFSSFLQEDTKLKTFLKATWQQAHGDGLAAEFDRNPGQPKFLRLFLRYIFEQRLAMNSSDAARVGAQIGNILVSGGKKEYNKMAYFDVGTKSFKWFEG